MLPQKETKANNHPYKKSVPEVLEVRLQCGVEPSADFVDLRDVGQCSVVVASFAGLQTTINAFRVRGQAFRSSKQSYSCRGCYRFLAFHSNLPLPDQSPAGFPC
jgi:hypothetical protein